ncbi:MAG: class I SAM-dependent methyltransferase [Desulfobacteraceae bacterium]|nr:class I SAM-dependent methyltransferase [Desulfobacteraceae bacterium]
MDNKRFYDLSVSDYSNEWYSNDIMKKTIQSFLLVIGKENPRILDLGCGPGHESMRLFNEGANVTGIDYSKNSIEIAKKRNPSITFYEMDFFDINKSLGKFDGIFACSSMIHLNKEDIHRLLEVLDTITHKNTYFMNIFFAGKGQKKTFHEINGEGFERIVEMFGIDEMIKIFEEHNYSFLEEGYLDSSLLSNWSNCIFIKR